jgi:hypothetical protein
MRKKIVPLRDIEIIESELKKNKLGIFSYLDLSEKVSQVVSTFIYADKNIYLFVDEKDEVIEKILFEKNVSFTIFRGESSRNKKEEISQFRYVQIKCSGIIKKVDENKIVDDVKNLYTEKYSISDTNDKFSDEDHLFIIDTDEIQAAEISE